MGLLSKKADSEALLTSKKKVMRKCYVCIKSGHLAKDSPEKVGKKIIGDAFVCMVEGIPCDKVWLVDSGASSHITKQSILWTSRAKTL